MTLAQAINRAHSMLPLYAGCVGWNQSVAEWVAYDPRQPQAGVSPEFFCVRGCTPLPLTDLAKDCLASLLAEYTALANTAD